MNALEIAETFIKQRCATCRWWYLHRYCDRLNTIEPSLAELEVTAADDTDLQAQLATKADFGCVQWEAKL